MVSGERPRTGFGCLGTLVAMFVLVAVVVTVIFVGFIALGIFAALLVIGLLVLAVDRVALAMSPKRRERRANQNGIFIWQSGQFRSGQVIDATVIDATVIDATVSDTTAPLDDPRSHKPGPDGLESN